MNAAWHTPDYTPDGAPAPQKRPWSPQKKVLVTVLSITLGVLATATAALGVLMLLKYNAAWAEAHPPEPTKPKEFTFAEDTTVSGTGHHGQDRAAGKGVFGAV